MTESLQWHPVSERMPNADETVIAWFEHKGSSDWAAGYYDGEEWRLFEVDPRIRVTVTHWAQPKGPQA